MIKIITFINETRFLYINEDEIESEGVVDVIELTPNNCNEPKDFYEIDYNYVHVKNERYNKEIDMLKYDYGYKSKHKLYYYKHNEYGSKIKFTRLISEGIN